MSWNHRVIRGQWRHMTRNSFFEFLTPKNYLRAFKNHRNVFYSSQGTRWTLKFCSSSIRSKVIGDHGFSSILALDLTSEVTDWPRTLSLYINLFVSRRATRSFFPRSSSSIRGETARGGRTNPPPCAVEGCEMACAGEGCNIYCQVFLQFAWFDLAILPHLSGNFCENFDPKPGEVRSPGQVKWPNYKIIFQSRHDRNVSGKVMKLSEYDEVITAHKTSISDFWYRLPQVRSFLRPPHYMSMGKKSTPLFLLWRKPIWVESYRIGQLWTIQVKFALPTPRKVIWGHPRSPTVICQ